VDAGKPNLGMTSWAGSRICKTESEIAKNYLSAEELDVLNRIITLYLEFAELQAINKKPMTMAGWIEKLDDFLRLSGRDILTNAGTISHSAALKKAHVEYEKYQAARLAELSDAERHFIEAEEEFKKIEAAGKKGGH
jgi:hypothetical protein